MPLVPTPPTPRRGNLPATSPTSGAGLVLALVVGLLTALPGSPVPARAVSTTSAWPGPQGAAAVDVPGFFGTDLSGLAYLAGVGPEQDRVFAVRDDGRLFRLVPSGGRWVADNTQGWGRGKTLALPSGEVGLDAEGVTVHQGEAWVSIERDGRGNARPAVLRFPLDGNDTTLTATEVWDLAGHYPGIGDNLGPESVAAVPQEFLVQSGFRDESTGARFDPAAHPGMRGGAVFLVAVEAPAHRDRVDAFVLGAGGRVVRVASFANPVGNIMDLDFDASTGRAWAVCDHFCDVRSAVFEVHGGRFVARSHLRRPSGLPNHNFEGFTVAPLSRCVDGTRQVLWANDANDARRALWAGRLQCPEDPGTVTLSVSVPAVAAGRAAAVDVTLGGAASGTLEVRVGSTVRRVLVTSARTRVTLGTFRTAGKRRVEVSWSDGTRTALATGTLAVKRAQSTLRRSAARVEARRGGRARVVLHLKAHGVRTDGRIRVRLVAKGRARWVRATVSRRVTGTGARRATKVVVRTPRITGWRARTPAKVVVHYRGDAHTSPARAAVRLRVR